MSPDRRWVGVACMDADVNSSDPAARYHPNPQRVSVFIAYNGAVISEKAWGGEFPTFSPLFVLQIGCGHPATST